MGLVDEKALIIKAQKGNKDALNKLVELYWQPIYRLIIYKIGNHDDAQELTQETFIKAFKAIDRYKITEASFKTYLGRIAINLVTDYWRKRGRMPQIIDIAEYQEPILDMAERPENLALANEQRSEIKKIVKCLPEEQKKAIEFRIIAGLSVKETAHIMNKSEAAIKMLQQRALKNLKQLFLEYNVR